MHFFDIIVIISGIGMVAVMAAIILSQKDPR
ncbi:MAG: hypothetical protein A4E64_01821 [Syntrophorhabdus sp. PtaU1.Bin058]|nr:MAG: hypothetical protein A4E64_01821 [Syntrophorhabdus sp. PtaU1.Bin058]